MARHIIIPRKKGNKSVRAVGKDCCNHCKSYPYSTSNKDTLTDRLIDDWGGSSDHETPRGTCICYPIKLTDALELHFKSTLAKSLIDIDVVDCNHKTKVIFKSNDYKIPTERKSTPQIVAVKKVRKLNNSTEAGKKAKMEGHSFEYALANHLGLPPSTVEGESNTKVDINGSEYNGRKISVKNASGTHTQVYLPTQISFAKKFSLDDKIIEFLKLFFGCKNDEEYLTLCKKYEIDLREIQTKHQEKYRVDHPNLPLILKSSALTWFNNNKKSLFRVSFISLDERDAVDTLAWAWTKNDPASVDYYELDCLQKRWLKGKWAFSEGGTTLEFLIDGKRVFYIQRKGSGKGLEVTNPMFHVHNELLIEECKMEHSMLSIKEEE